MYRFKSRAQLVVVLGALFVQITGVSASQCENAFDKQAVKFGEIIVDRNSVVIWQVGIRSSKELRMAKLLSESEVLKFVTDNRVSTNEIMIDGELIKSEVVLINEGLIKNNIVHKYFHVEKILCSGVSLYQP